MTTFEVEFARLSTMSKKAIIEEGVERGFFNNASSNVAYMMRNYSKILLSRTVADKIIWAQNNL